MLLLSALATAAPDVFWPHAQHPLTSAADPDAGSSVSGQGILDQVSRRGLPDDPRLLGRALATLTGKPDGRRDARSWWLQGRIEQRLHRFPQARASLDRATALAPQMPAYVLEQFYVALAQGDARAARQYCDRLASLGDGIVSASCNAQWQLQFGNADDARTLIEEGLARHGSHASTSELVEARITLADVLSRLNDPQAIKVWLWVLGHESDNHYARDQLARQLLVNGRFADVERITRERVSHLGLAVSRVIALQALGDTRAAALESALERRWRLARWRDDQLHRNEFVRYLARVKKDRPAALALARAGWRSLPTPENRRVLEALGADMDGLSAAVTDDGGHAGHRTADERVNF